jgi:sterol desaturase/sphingolipid hydroxylase (fatty acid hydroxylase superfamily)
MKPHLSKAGFFELTFDSAFALGLRYMLFAGIAWLLGYLIFKRPWAHRKIIQRFPPASEVRREILYSVLSMIIFGAVGAATIYAVRQGWTQLYSKLGRHSMGWFWISIVCAIVIHDAWFYWTHRLMHHRRLFCFFHRVHHLSHNPTPWAAYAFSPAEAIVQALIFPILVIIMPMHLYAFAIFMLWQILFNVAGHVGYEFFPRWLLRTPVGWILNTPTNHIMHHETLRGNYGLYFNIWDRLMGTNHRNYRQRFEEVTSRPKAADQSAAQDKAVGV